MNNDRTTQKPMIGNAVLTVTQKNYLTPNYLRITLTGPDVKLFENCTVGTNNKIFIPPAGVDEIHFPEFDPGTRSKKWPAADVCPIMRTFTHRGINISRNEIYIEFALHGDKGPASAWAIGCKTGDKLGVAMRTNKADKLYKPADWYLLAGDATAIPVIGAIMEDLPMDAKGVVYLEVGGPEDAQILKAPIGIEINWLYNQSSELGSLLPDAIRSLNLPVGNSRFAYVAAEFGAVKAIREFLQEEKSFDRNEINAYAYWKAGVAEDQSASERREEHRR